MLIFLDAIVHKMNFSVVHIMFTWHQRSSQSAIIYLYVGFTLSVNTDEEFNAESAHPKLHRESLDEDQGSVDDDDTSNSGSKLGSEESTSVEKSANETVDSDLTLEILESWRLEAVDGLGDTKVDENSAEQIALKETRNRILKNNNQMNTNCPKTDFEFIIIVQGKAFILTACYNDVGDIFGMLAFCHQHRSPRSFNKKLLTVHNRKDFLRMLLKSLRSVKYINTALVVISIDIYDEKINELIQGIFEIEPSVCFTIIYHPYSMAFYQNQYPAEDPRDCSRGTSRLSGRFKSK